eukprot:scaffold115113_cov17-Prasinocladus_malaysianus.AAC.2
MSLPLSSGYFHCIRTSTAVSWYPYDRTGTPYLTCVYRPRTSVGSTSAGTPEVRETTSTRTKQGERRSTSTSSDRLPMWSLVRFPVPYRYAVAYGRIARVPPDGQSAPVRAEKQAPESFIICIIVSDAEIGLIYRTRYRDGGLRSIIGTTAAATSQTNTIKSCITYEFTTCRYRRSCQLASQVISGNEQTE